MSISVVQSQPIEMISCPSQKRIKEIEGIAREVSQPDRTSKELLAYKVKLESFQKSPAFHAFDTLSQKRIGAIKESVTHELARRRTHFVDTFSDSRLGDHINLSVLQRVFPSQAQTLSRLIMGKGLAYSKEKNMGGESTTLHLDCYTPAIAIKYRIKNWKPQIIISQNIGEGAFSTVEKVAVVIGDKIEEAPDLFFARSKLLEEWRTNAFVQNSIRQASSITQRLFQLGVTGVVPYSLISPAHFTVASPLHKESLDDFLTKNKYDFSQFSPHKMRKYLKNIVIPVVKTLDAIHRENFVHLDLSLGNILLTEEGKAHLGDFGACNPIHKCFDKALTTPLVAAPETFDNGGAWEALPCLDMWAVGMLVSVLVFGESRTYESFYRKPNFSTCAPEEKSMRVKEGAQNIMEDFATLSSHSVIDERIILLVQRLLSLFPNERPSASEVAHELEKVLRKKIS